MQRELHFATGSSCAVVINIYLILNSVVCLHRVYVLEDRNGFKGKENSVNVLEQRTVFVRKKSPAHVLELGTVLFNKKKFKMVGKTFMF